MTDETLEIKTKYEIPVDARFRFQCWEQVYRAVEYFPSDKFADQCDVCFFNSPYRTKQCGFICCGRNGLKQRNDGKRIVVHREKEQP